MSTDAFAAAVGKGAAMRSPSVGQALRAGIIFGAIEGVLPLLGWLAGRGASIYVVAWDHWLAFSVLALLGVHMIHAGLTSSNADDHAQAAGDGFWMLAVTGLATSIDALAVGVGLAFVEVPMGVVALTIGLCTFVMVTLGILLGRSLGAIAGKRAEIFGGIVLIGVGAVILLEHLFGAAI